MGCSLWPLSCWGLIFQGVDHEKIMRPEFINKEMTIYRLEEAVDGLIVDDDCCGVWGNDLLDNIIDPKNMPFLVIPCAKRITPFRKAYESWEEMAREFTSSPAARYLRIPPVTDEQWWKSHLGYLEFVSA